MLTPDETADTAMAFLDRLRWFGENVPDIQERSVLICAELGVPIQPFNGLVDALIEYYMEVPPELVRMITRESAADISAGIGMGIMLGKLIEQESHVQKEDDDLQPALCAHCGRPWQEHYDPDKVKYKLGPFGSFGLKSDHRPLIPGLHALPEEI